jgi:uncharacterized protein YjbI with pentapeptide repeats
MANSEHINILKLGAKAWNEWRNEQPLITADLKLFRPDLNKAKLADANLSEMNLEGADMSGVDLSRANLKGTNLTKAYLDDSILTGANLSGANLSDASVHGGIWWGVDLSQANIDRTNFERADFWQARLNPGSAKKTRLARAWLHEADLSNSEFEDVDFTGSNLWRARCKGATFRRVSFDYADLVEIDFNGAIFDDCSIYGASIWGLKLRDAIQSNLTITRPDEPTITVDNLEMAQFIYLLLNNEKVRGVIDTITSKVVLILGRFTDERKRVLDAIREELRKRDLAPILFDFEKPASKDLTGTVETLARMSRLIIADITDPRSVPAELAVIVPQLRKTPVLTLKLAGSSGYALFDDLYAYQWVLKTHEYTDLETLILSIPDLIAPANEKARQLRGETPPTPSIS